jgi:ribosomal protein L36
MVQRQGIPLVARSCCGASQDRIAAGAAAISWNFHDFHYDLKSSRTPDCVYEKRADGSASTWASRLIVLDRPKRDAKSVLRQGQVYVICSLVQCP